MLPLSMQLLEGNFIRAVEMLKDLLRDDSLNLRIEELKTVENERTKKRNSATEGLRDRAKRVVARLIHEE